MKQKKKSNKKKNNKAFVKVGIVLIGILLVAACIYLFSEIRRVTVKKDGLETKYVIHNNIFHPMKKDGLEITKMEIRQAGTFLETKVTIKNNTNKTLKDYEIGISVLNGSRKEITQINTTQKEELKPNQTAVITGMTVLQDNKIHPRSGKILYLNQ